MSFGTTTVGDILALYFNSVALPGAYTTNLYAALHTADPGVGGNQSTSEISYTGYVRLAISRSGTGQWTVNGRKVSNVNQIQFGEMTAGAGGIATHISLGLASSGATQLTCRGPLSPTIAVGNGVQPTVPVGGASLELVA